MKLQTQNIIYNIAYSSIILVITGIFLQLTLFRIYYKQIDNSIIFEREIIEEEIEHLDTIPDYTSIFGHQIEVFLLQAPIKKADVFKNIELYNTKTHTNVLFRNHYFAKNRKNGLGYSISIYKPLSELQKFRKVVMYSISLAFLFLVMVFLGTGFFVNRRLWNPFYKTLNRISNFNLDAPSAIDLPETNVKEFKELNHIISSFSQKMKSDFIRMKEFSENLSHEINTMLAIIRSKIEIILQKEDLQPEQIENFKTIYHVTNNLAHLNNGLLLLAKIDNQFYTFQEPVDMTQIVLEHLDTFNDFMLQKNLALETNLNPLQLYINKTLANILMSNIIVNAIKHNHYDGFIQINLTEHSLIVINSCCNHQEEGSEKDYENLFSKNKPFKSVGLGIEIIRRICRIYNFSITYLFEYETYKINIGFK